MPELPHIGRGVGKRYSQDVMGPHMSCAVDNTGPESDAEVKMLLPQPEPASRPKEKRVSSPTENTETKEESSTTISKHEESRVWEKEKASWLPSSSESDSGSEVDDSADGDNKNSQVWEIPLENVNLADKEKKEDCAMLP